ncbi:type VI secretion protein [Pseudomonas sp. 148P]|uniref:Type VI secretion protein n=1 Tax=Pseudomonas ulcerans TaxID=3115852 RepID=A0ABU7HUK3_9PSED|nr:MULTISPECIES: type VI secretion protein [unclassified Pseudomonas]MEE1924023.1 type VI secretion protein [Pseudomonas sp. 147P]MEE1935214.1 type VI secretion protein [Pseudomonas sp. 148P]
MRCFPLCFFLLLSLAGCSGNYVYSDADYRPLGDPRALERGV